jgi:hypothetical protein
MTSSTSNQPNTLNINRTNFGMRNLNFESKNARVCDICNHLFELDSTTKEIEEHYALHYGPSCPVCFLAFRKGYPQKDFENHVNAHFQEN